MSYVRDRNAEDHWRRRAVVMPAKRTTIRAPDRFSPMAVMQLFAPLLPQEMEDKWIGLPDPECTLIDFHRSWTGFHIYRVHVHENEDGWLCIDQVEVNRDPDQYTETNDAYDADMVRWLIRALLLDEDRPFPPRPDLAGTSAFLAAWSSSGSAILSDPPPDAGSGDSAPRPKRPRRGGADDRAG